MSAIGPNDGPFDCSNAAMAKISKADDKMVRKLLWTALGEKNVDQWILWEKAVMMGDEYGYFFKHLQSYKKLAVQGDTKKAAYEATAKKIFEEHIKGGAKKEVNIPATMKAEMKKQLDAKTLTVGTFDPVSEELRKVLMTDVLKGDRKDKFDELVKGGFKFKK